MQKVVRTKMKTKVNWPGRCQASLVKPGDVFVTHKQAHMAVIVVVVLMMMISP